MPNRSKKNNTGASDIVPDDKQPMKKKVKSDLTYRTQDSEPTWDLGKNRFVKLSDFKGQTYINIREFYDANGTLKPGKKGIALTPEQWQRLRASVDHIDEELKKK
ncbi:unnamed protein product [Ceutorhynchus assimilis]|uniref:Transcriptional coactivator p15 (PC4) C-terminal domain-containing protein n=1 Tax=Ceutorhynchus assimilis TaxID=467358 RepID=A0A9P0DGN0_9CUCU|nr:unnamed protein product [Ceutorhynchus assimilis]